MQNSLIAKIHLEINIRPYYRIQNARTHLDLSWPSIRTGQVSSALFNEVSLLLVVGVVDAILTCFSLQVHSC